MIKVLDTATVNKIAAGEVIERPFSVVKELVENSIDAGSTKITVEIKDGGVSFIKVADNGSGIMGEDMESAFKSHATSKISDISDLDCLATLGFRGEALASVAAVSQLEVTSKTVDTESAAHMEIYGGEITARKEAAGNGGTIIVVRNLFFNTPARKKFLKSTSAETGYIADYISKIALSRPDISFRFINNGRESLYTSGSGGLKTAIFSVYGAEYAEKLMEVDYNYRDIILTGYIAKPEIARSNRFYEDLFVNGRYVKDKIVSRAAEEAYKTYLPIGKFPSFVFNMAIDGDKVDVNAHPQKLEVRFKDEDLVYSAVYNALTDTLRGGILIHSGVWGKKNDDAAKRTHGGALENEDTERERNSIEAVKVHVEPESDAKNDTQYKGTVQSTDYVVKETEFYTPAKMVLPIKSDEPQEAAKPMLINFYEFEPQLLERSIFEKIDAKKNRTAVNNRQRQAVLGI